jgi:hypothetical protein
MSFGDTKKTTLKIPKDALITDLNTTDALSQYQQVDAINPVIESAYVTRVTYAGYSGIKSENVPPNMRNVDPTYFGTICPVDTPECLEINTLVYRYNDKKHMYEPVRILDLKKGDTILGFQGPVKVKSKHLKYKLGLLFELENGSVIICSEDHRFYVYDKEDAKYKVIDAKTISQEPNRYEFVQKLD